MQCAFNGFWFFKLVPDTSIKMAKSFSFLLLAYGPGKNFTVKKGAQFRELASSVQRVRNFIAKPFCYKVVNSLNTPVCV